MRKLLTGVAVAGVLALGLSAYAVTSDEQLVGKKILIKNPPSGPDKNKVVFVSKDGGIDAVPYTGGADPVANGGYIHVSGVPADPMTNFTIVLPKANWTLLGAANQKYRYKDTSGATCKIVIIKGGKLEKALCKGTQVAFDLGVAQTKVNLILGIGSFSDGQRDCYGFQTPECQVKKAGDDGKTYLAKKCGAATAPTCASPSGAFLEVASLF